MNILSIQSHVAYGHVGNAAATFPLQRMGVEVWPIHTVQFSNHTGYGGWKGRIFEPGTIGEIMAGIAARNVLGECDGVLSGYIGSAEIGAAILDAVATIRHANPKAKYCCDPVIGDVGCGIFVRDGVPEFMRGKAVSAADIITPNQFELDYLSGDSSTTRRKARDAVNRLHDLGPTTILVTSLHTEETPDNCVDMLASDASGCFLVRTPKLPLAINGAGDAVAAMFFAHYLRRGKIGEALSCAASSIFGILSKTADMGAREIQLIAAQDEIVAPCRSFEAEEIRTAEAPSIVHDVVVPSVPQRIPSEPAAPPPPVPSVYHIDRLELSFVPKEWRYASEHRAEIDQWFEALQLEKPAVWNGRVLLMHHHAVEHGVLRGEYLETDFASFAAWRQWGRPPAAVRDCFGAAVIAGSDGGHLLGVMGSHTFNAGRVYFPSGTPDPGDIVAGQVDLDLAVRRELKEETGLDATAFDAEPGWTMVVDGPVIAQLKVLRSRENAAALRKRALTYLAREKNPELSDIRIVYGPGDFDSAMPRFVTAFLAARFAAKTLNPARA